MSISSVITRLHTAKGNIASAIATKENIGKMTINNTEYSVITSTTDSGVLSADFVPCYHKQSGEIGMYDLVSRTFFTNAGSGTFTKGADV